MRRREFIAGLGAVAWPLAARAQQTERVRRIGVLIAGAEDDRLAHVVLPTLREELKKRGWIEGSNLRLDIRFAGIDPDGFSASARELVGVAPDLIFTSFPTVLINAVQRETRTIPIVFAGTGGLAESGVAVVVANIARPEGNTTGITNTFYALGGKWLQLLKEAAPRLTRVAGIYHPAFNRQIAGGGGYAAPINAGAPALGIQVTWMPYHTAAELDRAIDAFAAEPNGGLLVLSPNGLFGAVREAIFRLATKYRLPTIYWERGFAEAGGLMSYGSNYVDNVRQSVAYVDRILRGAKPRDLPVQYPSRYELVLNRKAAKAIGLEFPATLIALSDDVID
jgi:putative ABC transport system substrate-binding protein